MNKPLHHVPQFDAVPAEPDDPRNRLLNAFEQFLEALVANDMGLQARLRFERHFPPLPAPAAAVGTSAEQAAGVEDELQLAALITDCTRLEKTKMSAAAHAAIARMKARALADLSRIQTMRDEVAAQLPKAGRFG